MVDTMPNIPAGELRYLGEVTVAVLLSKTPPVIAMIKTVIAKTNTEYM